MTFIEPINQIRLFGLEKYFSETQPLAAIFKEKFKVKFFEIDAMQEISKIQSDIENRLKNA